MLAGTGGNQGIGLGDRSSGSFESGTLFAAPLGFPMSFFKPLEFRLQGFNRNYFEGIVFRIKIDYPPFSINRGFKSEVRKIEVI